MILIPEGRFQYEFPSGWQAIKYDESSFYRNRFIAVATQISACDIVAISPQKKLFFIECKDYSGHARENSEDLIEQICRKITNTLGGILAGRNPSGTNPDQAVFQLFSRYRSFIFVLHLELPIHIGDNSSKKLFVPDLQDKISGRTKKFGGATKVVDQYSVHEFDWVIRRRP